MAMVIDDRLHVCDEKDRPRVHVVPAYTQYYAPQAEVLFSNEKKIGIGMGKTRAEAQVQAAEKAPKKAPCKS